MTTVIPRQAIELGLNPFISGSILGFPDVLVPVHHHDIRGRGLDVHVNGRHYAVKHGGYGVTPVRMIHKDFVHIGIVFVSTMMVVRDFGLFGLVGAAFLGA